MAPPLAIMPDFSLETQYGAPIAGVDEAGRGPWAGPVVAAAVILNPANIPEGLNDSKKLSAKKREALFAEISEHAQVGVGIVDVQQIDVLNILGATKQAMVDAVTNLPTAPATVLIDGNQPPQMGGMRIVPVIKGDSKSLSIAAASIIAKVTRDRIMHDLHEQFPHYGWNSNAGYGAKAHQEGIAAHGITKHHRTSFRPIREYMEANHG